MPCSARAWLELGSSWTELLELEVARTGLSLAAWLLATWLAGQLVVAWRGLSLATLAWGMSGSSSST